MFRARHSWEAESPERKRGRHSWESPSASGDEDETGSSSSDDDDTNYAEQFIQHQLDLYMIRAITAQDFCISMWLAAKSGIAPAERYGYKPGAPSGHYQRHLSQVLECFLDRDWLYHIDLAVTKEGVKGRSHMRMPVLCPHELIDHTWKSSPALRVRFAEMLCSTPSLLPPAYWDHPLVVRARESNQELPLPVGLFIDAVPYSLVDSAVGLWCILEPTGERLLVSVLRKQMLCSCGCRGWCSYRLLFDWLAWSFTALADGRFPLRQHNGDIFLKSGGRVRGASYFS